MKKKLLLIIICLSFLVTGCMKESKEDIKNKFVKNINNLNSYVLEGNITMTNNEDTYDYTIEVSYKKDDYYKVTMKNKANDYEQTILRNDEGVYVITPSLNKSFKFQSKWPYNNSQSYILNSIVKDLENDKEYLFEELDDTYVFTNKVSYPNNLKLTKQNIILDKDLNLKKVEVTDDENTKYIEFIVKKYTENPTFDSNYFLINEEEIIDQNDKIEKNKTDNEDENISDNKTDDTTNKECVGSTCNESTINEDNSLFPLYLPANTSLSDKEVINTDEGKRVILTFAGDSPFILVQETVKPSEEFTTVPTYGDPYQLMDTIGSLTDISYTWVSNGIEYYIVSDVLNQNELLEVAKSITTVATVNEK